VSAQESDLRQISMGWLDVLMDRARRGDVTALRLALGSILDIKAHQFVDDDGVPMSFADLARKARGSA